MLELTNGFYFQIFDRFKYAGLIPAFMVNRRGRYHSSAEYNNILAEDITDFLKKEGVRTQKELAKSIGISESGISRILNGRFVSMRLKTLEQIARALGTNVEKYIVLDGHRDQSIAADNSENEIRAYDMVNGVTYIGLPRAYQLKEACTVPTVEVARRSQIEKRSLVEILREQYEGMRTAGVLISVRFSKIEAIATYDL